MIKTEHKGFGLQKIEVNTQTRLIEDQRGWYAMYERRSDGVQREAFGVSPEDAAQQVCNAIDIYLVAELLAEPQSTGRFQVPSKIAGEPYEDYLWRVMQGFEEWVNKVAQEKQR